MAVSLYYPFIHIFIISGQWSAKITLILIFQHIFAIIAGIPCLLFNPLHIKLHYLELSCGGRTNHFTSSPGAGVVPSRRQGLCRGAGRVRAMSGRRPKRRDIRHSIIITLPKDHAKDHSVAAAGGDIMFV
jgi:hypothetical protein